MGEVFRPEKAQALSDLLKRINKGKDVANLRKEAGLLLSDITPDDISAAEKSLLSNGYSARLVQQLSAAFVVMALREGQRAPLSDRLDDNHILRRILAEHDLARCFLADLKEAVEAIKHKKEVSNSCAEFMRLAHIVEHLDAMEEHVDREDDVIFPYLKRHGWTSLCRAAHSDHVYIRIALNDLALLIASFDETGVEEFKVRLASITRYLCPTMQEHLFQEDNVLFPIAMEVIDDESVWSRMKTLCDEIGYCGVHL
ncbi:MAG: DUF438 domain-containing protein [Planctomycetes bacterium]|nr:DUF438 domain-containing protein [Planctomycetota bacterium]